MCGQCTSHAHIRSLVGLFLVDDRVGDGGDERARFELNHIQWKTQTFNPFLARRGLLMWGARVLGYFIWLASAMSAAAHQVYARLCIADYKFRSLFCAAAIESGDGKWRRNIILFFWMGRETICNVLYDLWTEGGRMKRFWNIFHAHGWIIWLIRRYIRPKHDLIIHRFLGY